MGHKAVVVFDMDMINDLENNSAEFAKKLKSQILSHRRTGGAVLHGNGIIANVVWSGHSAATPTLKFVDFQVEIL